MAKFKIGDEVRLKKGLEVGKACGGITLLDVMVEEFEKADDALKIEEISYMDLIAGGYRLGYDVKYFYSEEMLELAEESSWE